MMELNQLFKYTVIVFNGLLTLAGIVIVGIASAALYVVENSGPTYFYSGVIAIGLLIILIAICGCVGGLFSSFFLLVTHSVLMVLLTTFTSVLSILIFVYKKEFAKLLISILMLDVICKVFSSCQEKSEIVASIFGYITIGFASIELMWVLVGMYMAFKVYRGRKLSALSSI